MAAWDWMLLFFRFDNYRWRLFRAGGFPWQDAVCKVSIWKRLSQLQEVLVPRLWMAALQMRCYDGRDWERKEGWQNCHPGQSNAIRIHSENREHLRGRCGHLLVCHRKKLVWFQLESKYYSNHRWVYFIKHCRKMKACKRLWESWGEGEGNKLNILLKKGSPVQMLRDTVKALH